jgi:type I restriction enzyme, S subunit
MLGGWDVSSEWQEYRLGDITRWASGATPSKQNPEYWGGSIPWISASSMKAKICAISDERITEEAVRSGARMCDPGTILLLVRGSELHKRIPIGVATTRVAFNQDVKAITTCSGDLLGDYLYYLLKGNEEFLLNSVEFTGIGAGKLETPFLQDLVFPLPTREEQTLITDFMIALDDKIELNRKTNETLEAMAKALFKSWFVDFDPVRAKAEGRPTGLPAVISDLFPDSFEDSELGEIPSGWATGRLEEILEIDPPRQLRRGSVSPYLEMKGVPTSGHSAVDVILREFSSGSKFRNGDTLLARITPCLENGKTAFVDFLKDGEIGWGSTEFIVICGRREETNPFAYYLARSEVFRNNAIQNMVGSSGRQRVPSDAVSGFTLQMPPEEILVKFGLLASDLMRRISANADQSVILSKIRDTLLPKLISGEIRIPDAEKMLEEVGI